MTLSASLSPSPLPSCSSMDGALRVSLGVMQNILVNQRPDTPDTLTPVEALEARAHVRAHVGHGVSWCHGVRSVSLPGQMDEERGRFRARPRPDTAPDTLPVGVRQLKIGVICPYQGAWRAELGDRDDQAQQLERARDADNLVARQAGAGASEINEVARRGSRELDSGELDSEAKPLRLQRYGARARLITDQPALPAGTRRSPRKRPATGHPPLSLRAPHRPPGRVLSPTCRISAASWQRPKKQTPATTGRGSGRRGVIGNPDRAAELATLARRFGEVKP